MLRKAVVNSVFAIILNFFKFLTVITHYRKTAVYGKKIFLKITYFFEKTP